MTRLIQSHVIMTMGSVYCVDNNGHDGHVACRETRHERMGRPWCPQNRGAGMDDLHHRGGVSVHSCVFSVRLLRVRLVLGPTTPPSCRTCVPLPGMQMQLGTGNHDYSDHVEC